MVKITASGTVDSGRYTVKAVDPCSSHSRVASVLEAALADQRAPRILDVGCDGGLLKRTAESHGLSVARRGRWVGLDRNVAALTSAERAGLQVHAADLTCDPPPEGPFDAVVFADVLEHLADPEAVLARWLPVVCAPHTVVVASIPNTANISVRLGLLFGRFEYADRGILDRDHLRFYTRNSAARMLERVGLVIDHVWPTPVPIHLLAGGRWSGSPLLPAAQSLLYGLTCLAPTLLGFQFVFKAHHGGHGR